MAAAKRLKSYFLRGLAVLLPAMVTIWIFIWGYKFIQNSMGVHINRLLAWLTVTVQGGPENVDVEVWQNFWVNGWGSVAGFVIALIFVIAVGIIVANVVGRTLSRAFERFIMNVPVLNQIYPYIKQVTDFLLVREKKEKLFSRVVLVEYPRKGSWVVGFVTGSGIRKLSDNDKKEYLTIFISTSPSPVTGFVIIVAKDETVESDMTIEEAFRFIISGGVIAPQSGTGAEFSAQMKLENVKL